MFGYFLYLFCYKPLSIIFVGIFGQKILPKQGHCELPRSPFGIVSMSGRPSLWLGLVCYVLSYDAPYLEFLRNNILIWIFGTTFFLGRFLHGENTHLICEVGDIFRARGFSGLSF